jgi:hypothetical protein
VYNVLNSGLTGNLSLCPADSNNHTYYVTNSLNTLQTPDVVLHSGKDKTESVLGVARLRAWGPNPVGVGDPDAVGREMVWEELRRVSTWTHARYHFEWDWSDGERRKYEWRRSKMQIFDNQDDLELVERGRETVVLATYKCVGLVRWKRKGFLRIRIVNEVGKVELERWETIVILTGVSLVELARRRAGPRRNFSGVYMIPLHALISRALACPSVGVT